MTAPAEVYASLFKEARVEVNEAVHSFVKCAVTVSGPTPLKQPGFFHRMADLIGGRGARARTDIANQGMHMAHEANQRAGDAEHALHALNAGARAAGHEAARTKWLATRGGKIMTGVGAAGLLAAPLAYAAGKSRGERGKRQARNVGMGAGFATGLATPRIIQGAAQQVAPYVGPQGPPQGYTQ